MRFAFVKFEDITPIKIIMNKLKTRKHLFMLSVIFFLSLSITSCNQDEVFIEPEPEAVASPVEETSDSPEDADEPESTTVEDPSTPCVFTLEQLEPNDVVIIDCTIDLEGETVNIPSGVTVVYEGGFITNGTVNFAGNTTIDSELLNNTFTIGGVSPSLKDATFRFDPERWGIVEGEVEDNIALENRNILQHTIDMAEELGVEIFEIDEIDAFFHQEYIWTDAEGYNDIGIHLPSNFHLRMTDDTFLRLQPNFWPRGYFLSVYNKVNVTISGGNLIGDRYEHDYSPINDELGLPRNTHEWPGIIVISGSENILVENTYMSASTGDALILGASGHRTSPDTRFNRNVIARGCTMNESRRNNISITDGEDLTIENCFITDAGLGDNPVDANNNTIITSAGIAPKVGIDIEPFRGGDDNGNIIDFEKVERVNITGCTFTGNNVSSFINFSGTDVTFQNNFSDHSVGASFDIGGTRFLNNRLVASERNRSNNGINFGTFILRINGTDTQLSSGSQAMGNMISGFVRGIRVMGTNPTVSNNVIEDFNVGIQVDSDDVICENNQMETDRFVAAHGIAFSNLSGGVFRNNSITVPRSGLFFTNLNQDRNSQIVIDNNTFTSRENFPLIFRNVNNVSFSNNTFNRTRLEQTSSQNIDLDSTNTFTE
jgi:hypothetical protein